MELNLLDSGSNELHSWFSLLALVSLLQSGHLFLLSGFWFVCFLNENTKVSNFRLHDTGLKLIDTSLHGRL